MALSQQSLVFRSSTRYTVRRPAGGWCRCPKSPVLFDVAVLVAILGSSVLVPFLQIGPTHGLRGGHGPVSPWDVAGRACLPSCKCACCQSCVSGGRRALLAPPHGCRCIFRGRPGMCWPLSHRFLLPPEREETAAKPALPWFRPCLSSSNSPNCSAGSCAPALSHLRR